MWVWCVMQLQVLHHKVTVWHVNHLPLSRTVPVSRMLWAPPLPPTGSSCSPLPLVSSHRRPHQLTVWTNPFGRATPQLTHPPQVPSYSHRLGPPGRGVGTPPPPQSQRRGRSLKATGPHQPHCSVTTYYSSTNNKKEDTFCCTAVGTILLNSSTLIRTVWFIVTIYVCMIYCQKSTCDSYHHCRNVQFHLAFTQTL